MSAALYLVLRGAPGVGKSTIASVLRERFPNGFSVEVDSLRMMVHQNRWDHIEQHLCAIQAAARLGEHYAQNGYHPILFVDTLSFGTLKYLTDTLDATRTHIYTLLASEHVLAKRLAQRTHGFNDSARSIQINENLSESRVDHERVIDTTAMSASAVAAKVFECEMSGGYDN